MIDPLAAIGLCRFLHDGALLSLWGAAAFVSMLLPKPLVGEATRRLGGFPLAAAAAAMLTTAAALPLEVALLGDGWGSGFDPETLHALLVDTPVGTALMAQATTGALLLLAFLAPSNTRMMALAVAAALGLGTLALTGHASMDQSWRLIAHRTNDVVHLLSAGAWLGALIPFLIVLKMVGAAEFHPHGQLALRRFSSAGHVAVALVLATGVINAGLTLGRWPTEWSSPYQLLLGLKIAAVCMMAGFAIINRYIFVPAIADRPDAAILAIRVGSLVEILLGFAAVGLVAVFGMLDPV